MDWTDVGEWKPDDLVRGLRGYIDSEDTVWPPEDPHYEKLERFLIRERPDPASLRPLIGAYWGEVQVDMHLLKYDKIARCVVHSFMGRIWLDANKRKPDEPHDDLAALWEGLAYAGVNFSFMPVYESSHPGTGESLAEFLADPEIHASDESRAAFERHWDALLVKWRARVTRKASSMYFGNMLRHVGVPAADRFFAEWDRMDENERYDLLRRADGIGPLAPPARRVVVDALLDDSFEVRQAAHDLLTSLGAPLAGLEASAREERIEKMLPALREWAGKTKS